MCCFVLLVVFSQEIVFGLGWMVVWCIRGPSLILRVSRIRRFSPSAGHRCIHEDRYRIRVSLCLPRRTKRFELVAGGC